MTMHAMKTTVRLLLCVLLACAVAHGQETNKAGTTAAQFLKIAVGARGTAMAGAVSAVVNDASALYWNPAGLLEVPRLSLYATHTNWIADIDHEYAGLVVPVGDNSRFGISATLLTVGEIEITTEQDPRGTGNFYKASDVAVGATYAVRMVDFFVFGTTLKYVTQSIYNESASAVAFDFGTRLYTGFNGIVIGMSYTNFGSTMKLEGRDLNRTYDPQPANSSNTGVRSSLETESWDLPTNFRVGIAWNVLGKTNTMTQSDNDRLILAVDGNHPNDSPENASVGAEYVWNDLLALRGGYHFNDDVKTWSAGVGIHWEASSSLSLGVDYALADMDRLNQIHVFSFTVEF
jgi:hypothetical protein